MFYSHEVLTSPECGVATIWLVATLGSRSITRRFNRKAIFDVDVPGACNVIVNPEAPMALRLQGNLLFGISRVYHEQCGYTLLDAQTMHDKMVSMLRALPGGGLDPDAGKAKPSNLLLPYDPAFIPETNLPGLNIDFTMIDLLADEMSGKWSNLLLKTPPGSESSASHLSVRLELGSDDLLRGGDMSDFNAGGIAISQNDGRLKRERPGDEEGVLLQPDFEIDENGNIVEFDDSNLSPRKRRKPSTELEGNQGYTVDQTGEAMDLTEEVALARDDAMVNATCIMETINPVEGGQNSDRPAEQEETESVMERQARQYNRVIKTINSDDTISLRNTDLARWNNEYVANMALALKQKQKNKIQNNVKKNGAFWVFGQGIGSVGIGLGAAHANHPLKCFSGEELYDAVCGNTKPSTTEKEVRKSGDGGDEDEDQLRRAQDKGKGSQLDSEIGRHAPPSLMDEHSSQMPWNLASAQSSRIGRLGSLSELSGKFGIGDSSLRGSGFRRGRLTSASPLAGRGYRDHYDSLPLSGEEGLGGGLDEELEISRYLEAELAVDKEDITTLSRRTSAMDRVASQLDQESMNFFDFIRDMMMVGEDGESLGMEMAFSDLLPPGKTSRTVATQGLMNVLTLATKGVLTVSQEPYRDDGVGGWGKRYDYGEIFMRMEGS
ncbi:hypothetical protein N7466_010111 [Penicillium verhagenii]|uniref:uncharacterized protein n=1 Tax=Penicillium verhagenii TaxID=1562060 RepID=UPI0025454B52|nr:uncharacterized protein N7466_010111 [Penicillium verhagenii]KAJ5919168.1 hypothetical protein N7466_010111 [Penicillium verhagenii]